MAQAVVTGFQNRATATLKRIPDAMQRGFLQAVEDLSQNIPVKSSEEPASGTRSTANSVQESTERALNLFLEDLRSMK